MRVLARSLRNTLEDIGHVSREPASALSMGVACLVRLYVTSLELQACEYIARHSRALMRVALSFRGDKIRTTPNWTYRLLMHVLFGVLSVNAEGGSMPTGISVWMAHAGRIELGLGASSEDVGYWRDQAESDWFSLFRLLDFTILPTRKSLESTEEMLRRSPSRRVPGGAQAAMNGGSGTSPPVKEAIVGRGAVARHELHAVKAAWAVPEGPLHMGPPPHRRSDLLRYSPTDVSDGRVSSDGVLEHRL